MKRLFCLLGLLLTFSFAVAEEGMYPVSELKNLDLFAAGLDITAEEIYNPDGVGLVQGIVKIGGCTGSFVSPQGLIFTNHHCAFYAAQQASTPENDYVKDGFYAETLEAEIPNEVFKVRITDDMKDVSAEVLSAVSDTMDYEAREEAMAKKRSELVKAAKKEFPGKKIEISEMFKGKTYFMFIYTYLRDVRLVYFPPKAIGNFGGDVDNWMWPRHTGDFAFMRAYVGPDGKPADYSPENVPYQPKKFLQVAIDGVDNGDPIFILGYPGRTYRHRTADFLKYEIDFRLPYVRDFYNWQISEMEKQGATDRAVAIKHASRMRSLANVAKNYDGKLLGLKRLPVLERKIAEETELLDFIDSDPVLTENYGTVLDDIAGVYARIRENAEAEMILDYLRRNVDMVNVGNTIYQAGLQFAKPDSERSSGYQAKNIRRTKNNIQMKLNNFYAPFDKIVLTELLKRAAALPASQRIAVLEPIVGGDNPQKSIRKFVDKAYKKTKMDELERLYKILDAGSAKSIEKSKDPFVRLARDVDSTYIALKSIQKRREGELGILYGKLYDVKKDFLQTGFVPDANRTLRFTFGQIKGYSPVDAIYCSPLTTVNGIVEKNTGAEPFNAPDDLLGLIANEDFGKFAHPRLGTVPIGILYDADTVGGNSGSPIFNSNGELIGINFDRAFEATLNDYAWSELYSRSIGTDIRYVLWVTQKLGGATRLLDEMNVVLD